MGMSREFIFLNSIEKIGGEKNPPAKVSGGGIFKNK